MKFKVQLEEEEVVQPVVEPEQEPEPRRRTPGMKWDAMSADEQLGVLMDMAKRGMIRNGKVQEEMDERLHAGQETRFTYLLYDTQEKVISYLRKNYADKD